MSIFGGFGQLMSNIFDPYNPSNVSRTNPIDNLVGGDIDYVKQISRSGYLNVINAIPYQFLGSVDARITNSDGNIDSKNSEGIGRKYAEKVLARAPLLFLVPCRQKFMEGFNNREQSEVLRAIADGGGLNGIDTVGKYYTTEFAFESYAQTVNAMLQQMAYFMGIGDQEITVMGKSSKLRHMDWCFEDEKNSPFNNYWAGSSAVVYYVDGNSVSSVTESFSNSTTESSLASTINGFSDQVKEIKFLLAGDTGLSSAIESMGSSVSDSITGALGNIGSSLGLGMLGDLASTGVQTVLKGGKIIFPKIWEDSQYSKSYSFDIKLRSPDHDSLSIFMNIIVPYIKILALVLPQNTSELIYNPNAYSTPYLVRAYCKGMFNIDMGLITEMSVTRGAECQWNDNGLPTQIDISLTIEDLYSSLMATTFDKYGSTGPAGVFRKIIGGDPINNAIAIVTNTGMMDYLSNLAGLNVAAEEKLRRGRMVIYLSETQAALIPSNINNLWHNAINNIIRRTYDRR